MVIKTLLICVFLCPTLSQAKEQLVISGEVFGLEDENKNKKLYNYARFMEKKGKVTVQRNEFKDLSGKLLVNETAELIDGKLSKMSVTQPQTGESGSIAVKGKTIHFTYTDMKGKVEKKTEPLTDNFNVHMTIIKYIQSHWRELMKGKSVRVRMGVWQRAETVGFKIWHDSNTIVDGKKHIILVMKPTTFIIRALVNPLYFTFKAGGIFLTTYKGRIAPKAKVGEKWKDQEATTQFKNLLLTL